MKVYIIRINTIDNLFADYMIEAENLFFAKIKARKAFLKNYPGADKNIRLELKNISNEKLTEIINIIKEAK